MHGTVQALVTMPPTVANVETQAVNRTVTVHYINRAPPQKIPRVLFWGPRI